MIFFASKISEFFNFSRLNFWNKVNAFDVNLRIKRETPPKKRLTLFNFSYHFPPSLSEDTICFHFLLKDNYPEESFPHQIRAHTTLKSSHCDSSLFFLLKRRVERAVEEKSDFTISRERVQLVLNAFITTQLGVMLCKFVHGWPQNGMKRNTFRNDFIVTRL